MFLYVLGTLLDFRTSNLSPILGCHDPFMLQQLPFSIVVGCHVDVAAMYVVAPFAGCGLVDIEWGTVGYHSLSFVCNLFEKLKYLSDCTTVFVNPKHTFQKDHFHMIVAPLYRPVS